MIFLKICNSVILNNFSNYRLMIVIQSRVVQVKELILREEAAQRNNKEWRISQATRVN
jgi:hypothetical protein